MKNLPFAGAQNIREVERYATGYDAKTPRKSKTAGSVETTGATEAAGSAESPRKRVSFTLS